jgi:hypothetical protein
MKLRGAFVPANAAVAAAGAAAMGASMASVRTGLESVDRVPGRFEALGGSDRPVVVIDYAHTPDGFERVLDTCRSLRPQRLVTVFGCGGDRDRTKRPIMGGIAQRMSDRCYLTTDNPRTERVEDIITGILRGMSGGDVVIELDREKAIHAAIAESRPGDLVALLGKHEDCRSRRPKCRSAAPHRQEGLAHGVHSERAHAGGPGHARGVGRWCAPSCAARCRPVVAPSSTAAVIAPAGCSSPSPQHKRAPLRRRRLPRGSPAVIISSASAAEELRREGALLPGPDSRGDHLLAGMPRPAPASWPYRKQRKTTTKEYVRAVPARPRAAIRATSTVSSACP